MKFSELYKDNISAVKRMLKSMWCRNATTDTQKAYIKQIEELIDNELFASEQYMPLVQCMEQYPSLDDGMRNEVYGTMKGLWEKAIFDSENPERYFTPYQHQWNAWKALSLNKVNGIKQSMVVTTGTGSGKTECFMLPLIKDLTSDDLKANNHGVVEALFLYPLNALMEDQKERLHKLLKDTNLTFASYNGNLPRKYEDEPTNASQRKTNAQIDFEREKYCNTDGSHTIVATREELWSRPANILLTNPSMLEYMLLRNEDQCLFSPGSLKWIVIDEAHSYSGAGAAELAMLIRRVLQAFNIDDPNKIRFALSSATIGNEDDATKRTEQLLEFISKLTGVDKENITTISADRVAKSVSINKDVERCRKLLIDNDYVKLDELFPSGTVMEKLSQLDAMCSDDGSVDVPLKAKVHFFYRVPNNGLRVCLDDVANSGAFKVKSFTPTNTKTPALELMRCEKCGEFFAVAEEVAGNRYCAHTKDGANLFDLSSRKNQILLFALTNKDEIEDGNQLFDVNEDVLTTSSKRDGYNLIANIHMQCPHCDADLGTKKSNKKDNDGEDSGMITDDWQKARTYRLSAEFISRTLAPSILPHLHKYTPKDGEDEKVILEKPHYGQQYISFVDSRQAAARSTLKQNLAQESAWIYSRLMNNLSERYINVSKKQNRLRRELEDAIRYRDDAIADNVQDDIIHYEQKIKEIEQKLAEPVYLSWMEAFDYLHSATNDGGICEADMLCELFANKKDEDECNQNNGNILNETKDKYILQAMLDNLGRHSRTEAGQESMGLFTSYYPKLQKITKLPDAVKEFNEEFKVDITIEEWKNLLKIFLDYNVRSNERFYFSDSRCPRIGIKELRRFATRKDSNVRRPVTKPTVNEKNNNTAVITLLAAIIANDNSKLGDVARLHKVAIEKVIDALWEDLLNTTNLIRIEPNSDGGYLNITDIAFTLFSSVYICNVSDNPNRTELRPVDTLFMGYSPYIIDRKAVYPIAETSSYAPYEYLNGMKDGEHISIDDIRAWSNDKRKILCEYGLWGETGIFTDRLDYIYTYPSIFIQTENTAQVDRTTSRQNQHDFKQQKINIMACSTTMEMGVDLGNMELVLMQSVPPHPTNYKQRAGRSGRNRDTRSVAITLCDSGAAGLRTLLKPLEGLINRPMTIPTVDLMSRKVVRRHINAALLRSFFQKYSVGDELLHGRVIDFFSTYKFEDDNSSQIHRNYVVLKPCGVDSWDKAYPDSGIGAEDGTFYQKFKNWINSDPTINQYVARLVKDTYYHNSYIIADCIEDIERCYGQLKNKINYYKEAYIAEADSLRKNGKGDKIRSGEIQTSKGYNLTKKYREILGQRLIQFFATHRMTPNATMPIAVISFNHAPKQAWDNRFTLDKPNDPSYTLREALSQYAPGNTVVLENKAIVVAGIDYTGIDLLQNKDRTFQKLYTDGNVTVVDNATDGLKPLCKWPASGRTELTLVRPVLYNADINGTCTRCVESNAMTSVSAQLVDVAKWQESSNPKRMLDMRSNKEAGNGQILYTNIGIGYGYAFCKNCGKAMVEIAPAPRGGSANLPDGFSEKDADGKSLDYHINIRLPKSRNGRQNECHNKFNPFLRNVVIGDTIQTDFCEIMIRKEVDGMWLNGQSEYKTLLTTIGLLISTTFADYLGKDRNDVDFVVMQNGHLCIYDTNPGGSGYSDQLADRGTMRTIISLCEARINEIKSKDELIDKFSSRYINDIDIEAAKSWITLAIQNYDAVPEDILAKFPNAEVSYITSMINDIRQNGTATLFVNSDFERWLFQREMSNADTGDWRDRVGNMKINSVGRVDIVIGQSSWIPRPVYHTLALAKGFCGGDIYKLVNSSVDKDICPIAIVNGKLYFTVNEESASLNGSWAFGDMYRVAFDSSSVFKTERIDLENIPGNCHKFTVSRQEGEIASRDLAGIVMKAGGDKAENLISEFANHCFKNNSSKLVITYRDEYVRTPLGMVVVLDFISQFVKTFKRNSFDLDIIGEAYYNEKIFRKESSSLNVPFKFSKNRDETFEEIAEAWSENYFKDSDSKISVSSLRFNTLPHWRDLKFSCAGKELIIYPNGGILNGWKMADGGDEYMSLYSMCQCIEKGEEMFKLVRGEKSNDDEIMFDIELR